MRSSNHLTAPAPRAPHARTIPYLRRAVFSWSLVAFLLALSTLPAFAQEPQKYWIYFEDDPEPALSAADIEVTERALQRRRMRGVDSAGIDDGLPSGRYLDSLAILGVEPVVQSRWLNAVSAYLPDSLARAVQERDFVRRVDRVRMLRPLIDPEYEQATSPHAPFAFRPADPPFVLDFGPSRDQLAAINAIDPLEQGIDGVGVRIGFLDTPYGNFQHSAFDHLVQSERLIAVQNFAPLQTASHGLSVASVAVGFDEGSLIGPAHGAEVLAAVTEYSPTETNQEEDYFVAGIEWLEAMGADVINVSLGYTTFDEGEESYQISDLDGETGVTTLAADRAATLGVVVVASAGNSGCASPDNCWYYVSMPADGDSVIAVGAVNSDSSRSSFSSLGPTADGRTKPDVAAPGSFVYVAIPDTFAYSAGTSFASPLVTGVVAQMLQVNPELRPMEVRDILRNTSSLSATPNDSLGWGIVNAAAAIGRADALASKDATSSELSTAVFPNPATDRIFIHINAQAAGRARLEIFDALGRRVGTYERRVNSGLNQWDLSLRHVAAGLYLYAVDVQYDNAADRANRSTGTLIIR